VAPDHQDHQKANYSSSSSFHYQALGWKAAAKKKACALARPLQFIKEKTIFGGLAI